ncbi:MAG: glucokinase [Deltaproteobacteria bacterium]|nr:glucokinase [Deltaproteobacteria bacterium]
MAQYILAGDIGGTKTNLAIYAVERPAHVTLVRESSFSSRQHDGLESVLGEFLKEGREHVSAAAFGIAGPVLDGVVLATNLPWKVETDRIAKALDCSRIQLMNDLETTAYGSLFLPPQEIQILHEGKTRNGHRVVIAAGTGLGQAFLMWDGTRYRPIATEGGHADFAPRTEKEVELLHFLRRSYPHVSYERLLSGPGLVNIFNFLDQHLHQPVAPIVRQRLVNEDPAAVIGQAGVEDLCSTCAEAVDIFFGVYGAQAGNLALTIMGLGGVYIGGGIIVKLLAKAISGAFMDAYLAKGRYASFMADIPVRIILNAKASQFGAAHAARELLAENH